MGRHRAGGRHRRTPPRRHHGFLLLVGVGAALAAGWTQVDAAPPVGAVALPAPPLPPPPPPPAPPPTVRPVAAKQQQSAGRVAANAALGKRGVMYLWGSKGPDAFDCSGLTQWSWRQAGVTLGPDTYTQVTQGQPVDYGQPVMPGDLIFPTASFDRRGPGHILLAISSTEAVEAPGRGMRVRVVPLPASYVARRPG